MQASDAEVVMLEDSLVIFCVDLAFVGGSSKQICLLCLIELYIT